LSEPGAHEAIQGIAVSERRIAALEAQVVCLSSQVILTTPAMLAAGHYAAAAVQLQLSVEAGHLPSRALLAWLFLNGREGIAKNPHTALELVEEGARLDCHHCQGVMAYCLWTKMFDVTPAGLIQIEDPPPPRVREMALASSTRGSAYGQFVLGILEEDAEAALAFFRLAAEQHLDAAQFALGKTVYEGGHCLPSQHAEALRWFQLAAAQGHSDSLFAVGLMHEFGHGVPADITEAIRWYSRAAAAGHLRAAHCVRKLQNVQ
jgi:TPR repeat protein